MANQDLSTSGHTHISNPMPTMPPHHITITLLGKVTPMTSTMPWHPLAIPTTAMPGHPGGEDGLDEEPEDSSEVAGRDRGCIEDALWPPEGGLEAFPIEEAWVDIKIASLDLIMCTAGYW